MAPMPNTNIQKQSSGDFEGGNAAPTFAIVPNDVMCCCKPLMCMTCWNNEKEFQSRPGITCDHANCTNQAYSECNGDVRFFICGPRLHAGCGRQLCQTHMKWIQYTDGLHNFTSCTDGCADEGHKAVWLWNYCLGGYLFACCCTCGWSRHKKKRMFVNGQTVDRD